MGQITTTQNLVAIKEVRHAGQWQASISIRPSGAETEIFRDNCVNAMAADALAPYLARPPTPMILTEYIVDILVYLCALVLKACDV